MSCWSGMHISTSQMKLLGEMISRKKGNFEIIKLKKGALYQNPSRKGKDKIRNKRMWARMHLYQLMKWFGGS